jgi:hypothetical protein
MKWTLIALLIPTVSFAAKIPVGVFEQAKLETLLRAIPTSLIKTEKLNGYTRRHHQFPKDKAASFLISCYADYFNGATVPSLKVCDVEVKETQNLTGDEFMFKITDAASVADLRKAIPYGSDLKKNFSHERVYGQGHDGVYRNLFRYSFTCKADACDVTFATKASVE